MDSFADILLGAIAIGVWLIFVLVRVITNQ